MSRVLPSDRAFRARVLSFWRRHGRHDLPWRKRVTPYRVVVSEVMLQQTQVARVIPKFHEFLRQFPSWRVLANASVADVLRAWQGMGYNRRALQLRLLAQEVCRRNGRLPRTPRELVMLPGIGPYTAAAICAFAYNMAVPMIETNIRRAYLHHFFAGRSGVPDAEIFPHIERTMDRTAPGRWFSALMDYGAHLATQFPNPNRQSAHYARQSEFRGSLRQVRGAVVRLLVSAGRLSRGELESRIDDPRLPAVVAALQREGFISQTPKGIRIRSL